MVIAHDAVYPRVSTAADVCPQVGWHGLDEVEEPNVTPDQIESSLVECFACHRQLDKSASTAIREYEPLDIWDGQTAVHL